MVAETATVSDVVRPARSRENMSRPVPGSTPSGCSTLMPPSAVRSGSEPTPVDQLRVGAVGVDDPQRVQQRGDQRRPQEQARDGAGDQRDLVALEPGNDEICHGVRPLIATAPSVADRYDLCVGLCLGLTGAIVM